MVFDEFYVKSLVVTHKDFPRRGYHLRDFTPLLADPKAVHMVLDTLAQRYLDTGVTHVAVLPGKGYLVASMLAYQLNVPIILFQDLGEVPGEVMRERAHGAGGDRTLELAKNTFTEASRVLLIDDVLASGGTLLAASALIRRQQGQIHEVATLIDLPDAGGRQRLADADLATFTLLAYSD
ncbi:adenine phosphoribosyltransferase [Allopseudospirillum japonicum]|uniref:Adenine phosphoribosyltransferase n=1 Tax=Allopseudospirillum japonicum TaxID=64971 RepID=A0A1H6TFA4_9GAMM|nr:adenine phosphoribosyltransferase [Allopseudospirillum japonicum]SEI78729.1 adenine phosphoribosyltransferase [Allopseudospirillum japonicum]